MEYLATEQRCLIASFLLPKLIQINFLTSIPRIWQPTILSERFKEDTHRYISQVFASFYVAELRVTSYCSHTVVVTTVTFRQICPRRALTLASTCRYFVQDVQHSVRGEVYISPILFASIFNATQSRVWCPYVAGRGRCAGQFCSHSSFTQTSFMLTVDVIASHFGEKERGKSCMLDLSAMRVEVFDCFWSLLRLAPDSFSVEPSF